MVQMGSVKELVLFSPDQLQDYLRKAEQGSISDGKAGLDRTIKYISRPFQAPEFELRRLFRQVSLRVSDVLFDTVGLR